MGRVHYFSIRHLRPAVLTLVMASAAMRVSAQHQQDTSNISPNEFEYLNRPLVIDWSSRHAVFSNPGTQEDARHRGKERQWQHVVNDPRYRMQWVRRYSAAIASRATYMPDFSDIPGAKQKDRDHDNDRDRDWGRDRDRNKGKHGEKNEQTVIHGDWSVPVGASGASVAADTYPAKYTFAPISAPDCTNDFVVYAVANSASTGANIVGVNNLYNGTCTGTVPTILFAYNVGSGSVLTSPVLSPDGTKVAFIESISGGQSILHILTLDKRGNAGCAASTSPCNGTAFNSPAAPGTNNSAVDTKVPISQNGSSTVMVTRSSPYVDYLNDIAYVGDDNGNIHKFQPVFSGTPAEVIISGYWPACTGSFGSSCGSAPILASPIADGCATGASSPAATCPGGAFGSGIVVIGGSNGTLFGVPSNYGGNGGFLGYNFASKTASVGTTVLDAPILDATNEKVYVATVRGSNLAVTQLTLSPSASSSTSGNPFVSTTPIAATMGASGTDAYNGALDNAYFTSTNGTGYMYFCGNATGNATPTLWRVAITAGTMASANDGKSFPLVSGGTGTNYDCAPLTEYFNSAQNVDYLFVGVKNGGAPAACGGSTCIMSFSLPTGYGTPGSSVAFPTSVVAATPLPAGTAGSASNGMSGIVVDNSSGIPGASQIYFGNPFAGAGVQMSQSGLQ